jgi:hypothetical protein
MYLKGHKNRPSMVLLAVIKGGKRYSEINMCHMPTGFVRNKGDKIMLPLR